MLKIAKLTSSVALLVIGVAAFVWSLVNYLGDETEYVVFYGDDEW